MTANVMGVECETSDLYLLAYLIHEGHRPIDVDTSDYRRFVWRFEPSEKVAALIEHYWKGGGRVNPATFAASIRAAKDLLFDTRRTMENKPYGETKGEAGQRPLHGRQSTP